MQPVDFVSFVEDLATASGEAILPFFRTALAARDKNAGGPFDPVTEADHAAETVMRRMIAQTFPAHGVIGEEFGDDRSDAEYVWALDPIDGTKSFISGMPVWGTLIGLQRHGAPCYGLMSQPFTGERFSGDGASALWRGPGRKGREERALHTRPCADLSASTVMTTHPSLLEPEALARFHTVEARTRLSRYGGDCYAYCMLAAGHVDLVIESGLKPYDIVALIPIIRGAGGIVTTWDGGDPARGGRIVAAGDARVHAQALALLNG